MLYKESGNVKIAYSKESQEGNLVVSPRRIFWIQEVRWQWKILPKKRLPIPINQQEQKKDKDQLKHQALDKTKDVSVLVHQATFLDCNKMPSDQSVKFFPGKTDRKKTEKYITKNKCRRRYISSSCSSPQTFRLVAALILAQTLVIFQLSQRGRKNLWKIKRKMRKPIRNDVTPW